MTRPTSRKTLKALSLIGQKKPTGGYYTAYSAAKKAGIHLVTIYRARKRLNSKKSHIGPSFSNREELKAYLESI